MSVDVPVDLTITTSGELGVAHIEARSDAGVAFIDSWHSSQSMVVVDSGRIVVRIRDADAVAHAALGQALTVEHIDSDG
jgi:hypothetical protein